jgi:hypothetical protein
LSNLNGRCPACRQPYDRENITFKPLDAEQIAKEQNEKKMRDKLKKQQEANSRKNLTNVRVIQRNLVYITNLPVSIAKEDLLKTSPYFGQYGKILKVVVNKSRAYNVGHPNGPSYSAYITFDRQNDALVAIQCVDGFWIEGRSIRAAFGTTKYCSYFLRDMACTNAECMYLHQLGGEADSFTKEDMTAGKHHFHDQIHPASQLPPSAPRTPVEGARTVFPSPSSIVGLRTSTDPIVSSDMIEPSIVEKATPDRTQAHSASAQPTAASAAQPQANRNKKGRVATAPPPTESETTRSILPPTASWAGARNRGDTTPQRRDTTSPDDTVDAPNVAIAKESKMPQAEVDIQKEANASELQSYGVFPSAPIRSNDEVEVEDLGFDPWAEGAKGLHDFIESPPRVITPDTEESFLPSQLLTQSQNAPPLSPPSSSAPYPFTAEILISKDVVDPRNFQDIPPGFLGATFHGAHPVPPTQASIPRKAARSRFGFAQEEEGAPAYTHFSGHPSTAPVTFESSASLPYQPDLGWSLDGAPNYFASQPPPPPPFGRGPEEYHPVGWVTSPSQIAPSPFGNWMIPNALGQETPPFLSAPSWNTEQMNSLYPSVFSGNGVPDMKVGGMDDQNSRTTMPRMIHLSLADDILHPVSPRKDSSSAPNPPPKEDSNGHSMPFFDSAIISAGSFSRPIVPPETALAAYPSIEGKGKRDEADLRSLMGLPDRPARAEIAEENHQGKPQSAPGKNPYMKRGQMDHAPPPPSWHGQYPFPNNPEAPSYSNYSHSYHHHPVPGAHHPHHSSHDQNALYPRNYPQPGRFHHREQRKDYDDQRRNRSLSGNGTQGTATVFAPNRPPYATNPQPFRPKHGYNKGYDQSRHGTIPNHISSHHPYPAYPPQQPPQSTSLPSHQHALSSPTLQSSNTPPNISPQLLSTQPLSYPPSAAVHSQAPPAPSHAQSIPLATSADAHDKDKHDDSKKAKAKKNARAPPAKARVEPDTQRGKPLTTISYEVLQTEEEDVWESHDPSRVEIETKSSWIDDSESEESEKETTEIEKTKETSSKNPPPSQPKDAKGKAGKASSLPAQTDQSSSQKVEKSSSPTPTVSSKATASAAAAPSASSRPATNAKHPVPAPAKAQAPSKKSQQTKQKKGAPAPPPPAPSQSSSVKPSPSSTPTTAQLSSTSLPSKPSSTPVAESVSPAGDAAPPPRPQNSEGNKKSQSTAAVKKDPPVISSPAPTPTGEAKEFTIPTYSSLRHLSPEEISEISQEMRLFLENMVAIPKPLLIPPPSPAAPFTLSTNFMPPDEETLHVEIPLESIMELSERYSDYEVKCLEERYSLANGETQDFAAKLHEVAVEMKKLI